MYKNQKLDEQTSLSFKSINAYFGNRLDPDNRWITLCKIIKWDEVEHLYAKKFSRTRGAPAIPFRTALASLIIKEKMNLTDRETLQQIIENPYLQIFIGLSNFVLKAPFHHSMMTHFRKGIPSEMLQKINEHILSQQATAKIEEEDQEGKEVPEEKPTHKGKLLIDATCAPSDIRYPTDLGLLNDVREKQEMIIDILWNGLEKKEGMIKPRTYRKKARKDFLAVATKPKSSKTKIRKAIGKQLGYIKRNLRYIDELKQETSLLLLDNILYRKLLVGREIYRQQKFMYRNGINRIDNRIVSLSQPHVRPISRGKAASSTEFGAKISISNVEGFVYLDRLEWESYHEGSDLIVQAESYKSRYGYFPESIHADKAYRNQANRKWCKEHGIRLSGPPLGRPKKEENLTEDERKALKKQRYEDEVSRIPVEGSIGVAKRRFSLSNVMAKLRQTSESSISIVFLVMNLEKIFRDLFCVLILGVLRRAHSLFYLWRPLIHFK